MTSLFRRNRDLSRPIGVQTEARDHDPAVGGYAHVNLGFAESDDYDEGSPPDRAVRKAALDYCEHASSVASGFGAAKTT
jgi:hypothetical protein